MKFEIYCDESRPDCFWSKSNNCGEFLLIGGLWLPSDLRENLKQRIKKLKEKYSIGGEIKWHKISRSTEQLYMNLIDLFIEYKESLRFRCIAVDSSKVDFIKFHENDRELGFYKFYYQMIKKWIFDFNEYRIFCDKKTNRITSRLEVLQKCLSNSNITSKIISIQSLPSNEVLLLQLTDILLGCVSTRLNESVKKESIKERVICYLEEKLGIRKLSHTPKSEQKFNIFIINLQGGW